MASSPKQLDFKFYLVLINLDLKFSLFKGVLGITEPSVLRRVGKSQCDPRDPGLLWDLRGRSGGLWNCSYQDSDVSGFHLYL